MDERPTVSSAYRNHHPFYLIDVEGYARNQTPYGGEDFDYAARLPEGHPMREAYMLTRDKKDEERAHGINRHT